MSDKSYPFRPGVQLGAPGASEKVGEDGGGRIDAPGRGQDVAHGTGRSGPDHALRLYPYVKVEIDVCRDNVLETYLTLNNLRLLDRSSWCSRRSG